MEANILAGAHSSTLVQGVAVAPKTRIEMTSGPVRTSPWQQERDEQH